MTLCQVVDLPVEARPDGRAVEMWVEPGAARGLLAGRRVVPDDLISVRRIIISPDDLPVTGVAAQRQEAEHPLRADPPGLKALLWVEVQADEHLGLPVRRVDAHVLRVNRDLGAALAP